MSKIQITQVKGLTIEYKGKNDVPGLERNTRYDAILIEGFTDKCSELHVYLQNSERDRIIYDSFLFFAEDWDIIGTINFTAPYIAPRQG